MVLLAATAPQFLVHLAGWMGCALVKYLSISWCATPDYIHTKYYFVHAIQYILSV